MCLLDSSKWGFKFEACVGTCVQRRTHTKSNKSKSAHFETANAHPIQYGAELTDGPSVFKAEGTHLISKQVKPKRGRETPLCRHGAKVLPVPPPQLGLTSPPPFPLLSAPSASHTLFICSWCHAVIQAVHSSPYYVVISICLILLYCKCLKGGGLMGRLFFLPPSSFCSR